MTDGLYMERDAARAILASARTQFLEKGYEKASLRKICAEAGVTTGALYFSFKNKEALFEALVAPTMEKLDAIMADLQVRVMEQNGETFDEKAFNDFMFDFLIENRDDIRLLTSRAEGSQYEGFYEKIRRYVETLMTHYATKVAGVPIESQLIGILTNMYFAAVSDLMGQENTPDELNRMADALRVVMETGFAAMLEHQKAEG